MIRSSAINGDSTTPARTAAAPAPTSPRGGWAIANDCSSVVVAIIDSGIDLEHPTWSRTCGRTRARSRATAWTTTATAWSTTCTAELRRLDRRPSAGPITATAPRRRDHRRPRHEPHWCRRGVLAARLMALKFLDRFGQGSLEGALAATAYALDHGARVLNNSWGGGGESESSRS